LVATDSIIRDNGESLYPVIRSGSTPTQASAAYLQWNPVFDSSVGSALRTYSGFLNDTWTAGPRWTLNLGVRWDKTDATDQAGKPVAAGRAWSPRLSLAWDPSATGNWTINAGVARYVTGISSNAIDLGSGAGRSSAFRYVYMGPSINLDPSASSLVAAPDALAMVFDWFFANGGTQRPLRDAPTYAGVNRVIGAGLTVPSAYDVSVGLSRRLGARGAVRVDGIAREFRDAYAEKKDLSTGRVADPSGQLYDRGVVVNSNLVERHYRALEAQGQYTFRAGLGLGGNYTLAYAYGNVEGESEASGPVAADVLAYPEYNRSTWGYPVGRLAMDERHNLRVWANYQSSFAHGGVMQLALLQQVTSGAPLNNVGPVPVGNFLENPGYVSPPPLALYYFNGRGDTASPAVVSTDVSLSWSSPFVGERPRVFARLILGNVFNRAVVRRPDTTIVTAILDPSLALFNPFTQTPIEGVHFRRGPLYGQALSADAWQRPRWFGVSAGIRF